MFPETHRSTFVLLPLENFVGGEEIILRRCWPTLKQLALSAGRGPRQSVLLLMSLFPKFRSVFQGGNGLSFIFMREKYGIRGENSPGCFRAVAHV